MCVAERRIVSDFSPILYLTLQDKVSEDVPAHAPAHQLRGVHVGLRLCTSGSHRPLPAGVSCECTSWSVLALLALSQRPQSDTTLDTSW